MDTKALTKDWIQYLKNNRIVDLKSDPSGKLNYRRDVTAQDLEKFLDISFPEEKVSNAIKMVLAKKGAGNGQSKLQNNPTQQQPGSSLSTWSQSETTPGQPVPQGQQRIGSSVPPASPQQPAAKKSKYSKDDAEDIEFREPGQKKGKVKEAIRDNPGDTFSEDDVEAVFRLLTSPGAEQPSQEEPAQQAEVSTEQKQAALKKIKYAIRDVLSPKQRKTFWRALNDTNISESLITTADAKALLQGAAKLRSKPTLGGRIFKGLQKDKIEVNDLQQAWKEAGFPDDTRDIAAILKDQFGFSEDEIEKVFSNVFDSDDEDEDNDNEPVASPAIQGMVDHINELGLTDEVKKFMEKEFGQELGLQDNPGMFSKLKKFFGKKAVAEDVRYIFTAIIQEERKDRFAILRQQEQTHLGRSKK